MYARKVIEHKVEPGEIGAHSHDHVHGGRAPRAVHEHHHCHDDDPEADKKLNGHSHSEHLEDNLPWEREDAPPVGIAYNLD